MTVASQDPGGSVAESMVLDFSSQPIRLATRLSQQWPVLLLSTMLFLLYLPVLLGLIRQWSADPNYSHGFFVPILTGYLIWRKRRDLACVPIHPSASGTVCVLLSVGLLFLGTLGAEFFLQRFSLWLMIVGLLLYFLGWPKLRVILFPIAFLLFMIPLPAIIYNEIVFPLQLLTSRFATGCLQMARLVPVAREGNLLVLPNSTLEVAEACSGIRSLISLLAFSFGYAYFVEPSLIIRSLLVLATIPVAVATNAFRLIITAFSVYHFGPDAAEGVPHAMCSYVIVVTAALLLIVVHVALTSTQRLLRLETSR
jgi:exosortase